MPDSTNNNAICYTGPQMLLVGFTIAVIILVTMMLLVQLAQLANFSCFSNFIAPENNVLGGTGALHLPSVDLPYLSAQLLPKGSAAPVESENVKKMPVSSTLEQALAPVSSFANLENFNNDLPNQKVNIPTDGTNYTEVISNMALEPSVIEQHKQYALQREKITSTASFNPERTDSQDIVPYVGLRRTSYLKASGDSFVDPTARQVPSVVDPSTLSKPVNLSWNTNKF